MRRNLFLFLFLVVFVIGSDAQSSAFTYQGKLTDLGAPANGTYEMQFTLFEVESGGSPISPPVANSSVMVVNGIFTVNLSFGPATFLSGADRWIELAVKRPADPAFAVLNPRQKITSAPYSIKSVQAETAGDSAKLGGVPASEYVVTTDPRMNDARNPLPGSGHYIQNGNTPQSMSHFNISGNGTIGGTLTGNTVNAQMQYNIGGERVFGVTFEHNTFAGIDAGNANTTGIWNSFFGHSAGGLNTTGSANSFFGRHSGAANTTGGSNSFFGQRAGVMNVSGHNNSYFGYSAGTSATTAFNNSFFGALAGIANTVDGNSFFGYLSGNANTTGGANAFFGRQSGMRSTTGGDNSFFGVAAGIENLGGGSNTFIGRSAGLLNTSGSANAFVGHNAGNSNTTGNSNTIVGTEADVASGGLSFASAIGAGAIVSTNNTLVLGRAVDLVNVPGSMSAGLVRSGTEYQIGGSRVLSVPNDGNTYIGVDAGNLSINGTLNTLVGEFAGRNVEGDGNTFVGYSSAGSTTLGDNNSYLGINAGENNGSGSNNTLIGANTNVPVSNLNFATAIGAGAVATESNSITLGRASDTVFVPNDLEVSGFTVLDDVVASNANISRLIIGTSSTEPGTLPVCLNSVFSRVNVCTSSIRFKDNVSTYRGGGRDLINRLRPVTFNWKSGGAADLGLVAEEVSAVEPRLAIFNERGEPLGVKYDRIGVVLIDVVKEQQDKIDAQSRQLLEQQAEIEKQKQAIGALRQLVCRSNRQADICRGGQTR